MKFLEGNLSKYEPAGYLSSQTNISFRKELKLRIRNHELMIERSRYHSPKYPREGPLCIICKNQVEKEKHFIFKCKRYDVDRKILKLWFNNLRRLIFLDKAWNENYNLFFINDNPVIHTYISDFLFRCIRERREYLAKFILVTSYSVFFCYL